MTHELSTMHYVVNRGSYGFFEARVRMVNGEVAAEWRPITVSLEQFRYGGYTPVGDWRPCKARMIE